MTDDDLQAELLDHAHGRTPRVVGLDLSISATGACYEDGHTATWKLAPKLGDQRLVTIGRDVLRLASTVPACAFVAIEGPVTRSAAATIIGMVHGAARTALLSAGIPYVIIPPASLKKYATGKGNADKTAMAIAALKRAGLEFPDDNQCDAWWLRAMALDHLGHPVVEVPAVNREAMAKVTWPELGGRAA